MRSFLTPAFRALSKQKMLSAISILGVGIALACVCLISLFILDELAFDRMHPAPDGAYLILRSSELGDGHGREAVIPGCDSQSCGDFAARIVTPLITTDSNTPVRRSG